MILNRIAFYFFWYFIVNVKKCNRFLYINLVFCYLAEFTYSNSFCVETSSWVHSLSCLQLFATPWIASCQASLSIINSQNLLKLLSTESVMPSNHLILCCPLLLLPSVLPSIRVFSKELVLYIRWPKYWHFNFSISPSNEYLGFPLGWTDCISLWSEGFSGAFSNTTVQKHQCFGAQFSL